ncbi:MAG: hypothetical protein Q9219_003548 [cf. Caloplaca sp. 3 TL-2023]
MAHKEHEKPSAQATMSDDVRVLDVKGSDTGFADRDVGAHRPGYAKTDRKDMYRTGKRQELMRNFSPVSALSFTTLLQATWEFVLM